MVPKRPIDKGTIHFHLEISSVLDSELLPSLEEDSEVLILAFVVEVVLTEEFEELLFCVVCWLWEEVVSS